MKLELNEDALTFGDVVRDALGSAGGDRLLEDAETQPGTGDKLIDAVAAELGLWDLDVRGDGDQLEAAAAACRAAGWWAAPGSIAERLARPTDIEADALAVVAAPRATAAIHASSLSWVGVDLDGNRSRLTAHPLTTTVRKSSFVVGVDREPIDANGADDAVLGLVLGCWSLLGMLDRALATTAQYVQERHQFGKPLAAFQSVQFQLTDAEVERTGLEELAKYALWSFATRQDEALVDALALRLAAIKAGDLAIRICHQLHGAIGFCDETTLSWISRYSRPARTLPLSLTATRDELVRRAGRAGLTGLFPA
jgi:3-oxo-4-pregnene-20-carboxyl-CoA dehydrogenase alpha subunit